NRADEGIRALSDFMNWSCLSRIHDEIPLTARADGGIPASEPDGSSSQHTLAYLMKSNLTRRRFLETTSLAGAGLSLSLAHAARAAEVGGSPAAATARPAVLGGKPACSGHF